jgi:hypothetical protein
LFSVAKDEDLEDALDLKMDHVISPKSGIQELVLVRRGKEKHSREE